MLGLMGLLAGQMMYRWKMGITAVTGLVVAVTLGAMALGPWGQHPGAGGALVQGPVAFAVVWVNDKVDSISGHTALIAVQDPTMADPRIPAPRADGTRPSTPAYDAPTGLLKTLPNYLFWMVFLFAFSYLGANLPIWRAACRCCSGCATRSMRPTVPNQRPPLGPAGRTKSEHKRDHCGATSPRVV